MIAKGEAPFYDRKTAQRAPGVAVLREHSMRNERLPRLWHCRALCSIEGKIKYVNAEKVGVFAVAEANLLPDALRGNVIRMCQPHNALQANLVEAHVHSQLCCPGRESVPPV